MLERGSSLHFKDGTFLSSYYVAYFRFRYTTGNFTVTSKTSNAITQLMIMAYYIEKPMFIEEVL